jgi:hypothetical protein
MAAQLYDDSRLVILHAIVTGSLNQKNEVRNKKYFLTIHFK